MPAIIALKVRGKRYSVPSYAIWSNEILDAYCNARKLWLSAGVYGLAASSSRLVTKSLQGGKRTCIGAILLFRHIYRAKQVDCNILPLI